MRNALVRAGIVLVLLAAGTVAVAQAGGAREDGAPDGYDSGARAIEDVTVYRDPELLLELIENPPKDFHLVDARTSQEYESGHIPGAVNIDYRELANSPPTDDRDALIIVYCRSGRRSGIGVDVLERLGYTRVLNWGGIIDWPFDLVR